MSSDDDRKVVSLRPPGETDETWLAKRLAAITDQLATLPPGDYLPLIPVEAARVRVSEDMVREMVETKRAAIKEAQEKKEREYQEAERLRRQEREKAEREAKEAAKQSRQDADRAERKQAAEAKDKLKVAEKEQRKEAAAAKEVAKEKAKAAANEQKDRIARKKAVFQAAINASASDRDQRLDALATEMGQPRSEIDAELKAFALTLKGPLPSPKTEEIDPPWDKPVDGNALLHETRDFMRRGIGLMDHVATIVAVLVPFCWCHNEIATHSPLHRFVSADPGAGKTTLDDRVNMAVPNPERYVEETGPSLYRGIDATRPTLFIDEADSLFNRRSVLVHILNMSWKPGWFVRRNGQKFSVWCPKILSYWLPDDKTQETALPRALNERMIHCHIVPWTAEEEEAFRKYQLTEAYRNEASEAQVLRRKWLRWKNDNAEAMRYDIPTYPAGFTKRLAANWRLQFLIAERIGGIWPEELRAAATVASERLLFGPEREGVMLLRAIKPWLENQPDGMMRSAVLYDYVRKTEFGQNFRGQGKISNKMISLLLDRYDIFTRPWHPAGRSDETVQAFKIDGVFREIVKRVAQDRPAEIDIALEDDDEPVNEPKPRKPHKGRKGGRRARRKGKRR